MSIEGLTRLLEVLQAGKWTVKRARVIDLVLERIGKIL